jgi:hypothetical protein
MTLKTQLSKLKDNWLLLLLIVVLFAMPSFLGVSTSKASFSQDMMGSDSLMAIEESVWSNPSPRHFENDFAPQVEQRKITINSNLELEIERGEFKQKEIQLKSIASSTNSLILYENSRNQGIKTNSYYWGNYQLKVEVDKYGAVLSQIKELGEITSISQNTNDITGSYQNVQIELESEKSRLEKYQTLFDQSKDTNEKLMLTDRIFDQERRIKYLEDSLTRQDKRVDYVTLNVNLVEERSQYSNIVFVKFSDIAKRFVSSFNGLITLIFVLLPYAIVTSIIWIIVRKRKRN